MTYGYLIWDEWRTSAKSIEVRDPYDGSIVGEVFLANYRDIEDALIAATSVFELTKKQTSSKKIRILERIVRGLKSRHEEFAQTIMREAGKPITLAREEVSQAIDTCSVAIREAEEFDHPQEVFILGSDPGEGIGMTRRFPIGTVLGITPFNFPLNLVAHKIASAIVSGNPTIIKPSLKTPLTALKLAKVICSAGALPGQVQVLPMFDYVCEHLLVSDPRIKMLSFTGSSRAGWYLKQRVKPDARVTLELGGNAALVVDRDVDLEKIISRIMHGSFDYAGQSCIHTQRIYVHKRIWKKFLELFENEMRHIETGDPRDPDVFVGPVITREAQERIWSWVCEALSSGTWLLGGSCARWQQRNIVYPIALLGIDNSMRVHREEVFGPVVCINPFSNFKDVIQEINDSRHSVQLGVYTNDVKKQFYAWEHFEGNEVIINGIPGDMPYGDYKESGYGEGRKTNNGFHYSRLYLHYS